MGFAVRVGVDQLRLGAVAMDHDGGETPNSALGHLRVLELADEVGELFHESQKRGLECTPI